MVLKKVVEIPVTLVCSLAPSLGARVAELETLLASVSLEDDGATLRFAGVNVQVVSGSGKTSGPVNSLGNLIVGYEDHE